MAGVRGSAVTAGISTGTSAKTLLQLVAPSNHRVLLREFWIAFSGTSTTADPITVDLLRQTDAGTMSSLTPKKLNNSDDETLQATAQHTATSEPSAGDILWTLEVHPQDRHVQPMPLDAPIVIPGGGRIAIRVTAAADVTAVAGMFFEE